MQIQLAVCVFRLKFADCAYSLVIPLTVSDSATAQFNYTHVLLFVCGFHKLFKIPRTLLRIPQFCLILEGFWAKQWFRFLFVELKTIKKAIEKLRIIAEKIIATLRIPQRIWYWLVAKSAYVLVYAQFG